MDRRQARAIDLALGLALAMLGAACGASSDTGAAGGSGGASGSGGGTGGSGGATGGSGGTAGVGGRGGTGGVGGTSGTGGVAGTGAGGRGGAGGSGGGAGGGAGTAGTGGAGGRGGSGATGGTGGTGGTAGTGGTPGAVGRVVVYVAFSSPASVGAYELNEQTGDLMDLGSVPAMQSAEIWWMAVSPSRKFLYSASRGNNTISIFSIDQATGKLTYVKTVPGGKATTIEVDATGQYLVMSENSSTATSWRVMPDGDLTRIGSFATGASNHGTGFHPSSKWAYVASTGGRIVVMNFDLGTGMLSANSNLGTTGVRTPEAHPNGNYVYAVGESGGKLEVWSVNQTSGALTAVASLPSGASGADLEVDVANGWVYSSSRSGTGIWANAIDAAGAPDMSRPSANYASGSPVGLKMDPRGKYLFAAHPGGSPGDVSQWQADRSKLTLVKGHQFAGSGVFYVLAVGWPR